MGLGFGHTKCLHNNLGCNNFGLHKSRSWDATANSRNCDKEGKFQNIPERKQSAICEPETRNICGQYHNSAGEVVNSYNYFLLFRQTLNYYVNNNKCVFFHL